MMTYEDAKDVVCQLIADKGRGFEWSAYKSFRYDISEDAKHLAVKLLDDPNNFINDSNKPGEKISIADALREAIGIELNCNLHRDYLYRILAFALDDDSSGNHITLQSLLLAKSYRINVLKMSY